MWIDYKQVVALTKEFVNRTDTTIHDKFIEKLVDLAANELRTNDNYIVTCADLDIDGSCGKSVTVPDFFEEFKAAKFLTGGCMCGCTSNDGVVVNAIGPSCTCPAWFVSKDLLTDFKGYGASCGEYGNLFAVQGKKIILPSATTATSLRLWYKSKNVDGDGLMVLNENWQLALASFCASHFMKRYFNEYPRWLADDRWQDWCNAGAKIRSIAGRKQYQLDRQAITYMANAILYNRWETGVY